MPFVCLQTSVAFSRSSQIFIGQQRREEWEGGKEGEKENKESWKEDMLPRKRNCDRGCANSNQSVQLRDRASNLAVAQLLYFKYLCT